MPTIKIMMNVNYHLGLYAAARRLLIMLTLTSDYVVEFILRPPPPQIAYLHLLLVSLKYSYVLERDSFDPSEYGHLWSV